MNLSQVERVGLLSICRDARSLILRDSESFDRAASSLEDIGLIVSKEVRNLNNYDPVFVELGAEAGYKREDVRRLFTVVREARNSAVHDGAWPRHLNSRLLDLLLILEEALMTELKLVEDLMVRNPLIATLWEPISLVRTRMLANSFSHLPLEIEQGQWTVLSDHRVMKFIRSASNREEEKVRLAMPVADVLKSNPGLCEVQNTFHCHHRMVINDEVRRNVTEAPLLVFHEDRQDRLVGILTAFDLL